MLRVSERFVELVESPIGDSDNIEFMRRKNTNGSETACADSKREIVAFYRRIR